MIRSIDRHARGAHNFRDWLDHVDIVLCDRVGLSILDADVDIVPNFLRCDSPAETVNHIIIMISKR